MMQAVWKGGNQKGGNPIGLGIVEKDLHRSLALESLGLKFTLGYGLGTSL